MTVVYAVANALMILGALIALIAALGLLRFKTPYARFHAAGKASPVAFLVTGLGASVYLGWSGAAIMLVAGVAMLLTLPFGVSMLYRAVHRSEPGKYVSVDELEPADREAARNLYGP
jgi:multicomponent Na+:H+ antiporter subunit G